MSRWWGWRRPVDPKPTRRSLRRDVIRLSNDLAEVSGDRNQLKAANEGLQVELKTATRQRLEAQAQGAAAGKAAEGLGDQLQQAEDRLDRVRQAVFADNGLSPEARLARVHQALTEGGESDG